MQPLGSREIDSNDKVLIISTEHGALTIESKYTLTIGQPFDRRTKDGVIIRLAYSRRIKGFILWWYERSRRGCVVVLTYQQMRGKQRQNKQYKY
jgi:hypothetical protein